MHRKSIDVQLQAASRGWMALSIVDMVAPRTVCRHYFDLMILNAVEVCGGIRAGRRRRYSAVLSRSSMACVMTGQFCRATLSRHV